MEREPEKRNTQRKEVAHTQTAQQAAGPQPGQEQERSHGLETQGQGQGKKRGQSSQAVTGVSGDRDSPTRVLQRNG